MKDAYNKTIIIIPSYEPDELLIDYAKELTNGYFDNVLVIDDGSGESYQDIFKTLEKIKGVEVVYHEVNKGKGRALKTAYEYIKNNYKNVCGVITADSDGQHLAKDCFNIANEMKNGKRGLYLGTRDLLSENVPFKSRNGNRITSTVFKALYGKWLDDTQTGLRGFLAEDLDFMIGIEGERYEYEMQVLIDCVRNGIEFYPIPIDTVYIDNNSASHFNAFKDSFRIYKIILKDFIKFTASSLGTTAVDFAVFLLLSYITLPALGVTSISAIDWISGFIARIISSILNFYINKKYVFKHEGATKTSAIRYTILCFVVICISNLCVSFFEGLGGERWLLKPIVDTILYFVGYKFQNEWVFKK